MEFHVSRAIRQKIGMDDLLFEYTGNVLFGDLRASREFARRFNAAQAASGEASEPLHAGALFAMGLIDELNHAMVARYRTVQDPDLLPAALKWFERTQNRTAVEGLLHRFVDQFPSVSVYRGLQTTADWLNSTTPAVETGGARDMQNREAAVEELLMLWLANANPAFAPFKQLFDDRPLARETIYARVTAELPRFFETRPPVTDEDKSLLDVLRAPMLASPDSLSGQLAFIREHWVEQLGPAFGETLRRTMLAVDVLQEEAVAIWMTFHPNQPAGSHGDGKWHAEGFLGDEFVGFGEGAAIGAQGAHSHAPEQPLPLNEYEAFSQDQSWMPTVVLIAKSTYVWLEQLSKKYLRHIHRLDQIPAEELALLASRGINGLWLIGLWERSTASQTIKRLRGQTDAVASAYSLKDYRIAEDLGGGYAYEQLRDVAARYGIRLASDMVPNHMGIDSTWVMEHPEWFLSRQDSPYPVYSFNGPDLSTESRFEIKIEDHYYDQTDAAVVFQLRERSNGETRFVYHGNDGTTFAWNDTAQLDYSKAVVREQVIQTILNVARQFPIIRFDAAMTLAKKHVQRLWFPLPGVGGSIPSRAEYAISQAEFDALMPHEFWREVVDRVAAEVPGTLLLAEAFWLLEGYFVRTLGMHRVYNSAFMNMLRDEENAKYRSYLKKTIEFDPDILKRYVNFMSNPDERTAIDQFGSGDKYFGTCTMLSTLPGLPMFGHGQIEAFTEKYGMEYKQARLNEWPNEDLVARHQREIAPLLKNRQLFAESHNFALYDFWRGPADVDENVFVYSNRVDHGDRFERVVVFYNNSYSSTRGTIHLSVAAVDKGSGELRQLRLSDALHLPSGEGHYLAWRDTASNLEYLRRADDFALNGFTLGLRGYQYAVLLDWRELVATEEQPWDRLTEALHGAGVSNLEEALSKLRLRPVHEALRAALSFEVLESFSSVAQREALVIARSPVGSVGDPLSATDEPSTLEPPANDGNPAATPADMLGGSSEEAIAALPDETLMQEAATLERSGKEKPFFLFLERARAFSQSALEMVSVDTESSYVSESLQGAPAITPEVAAEPPEVATIAHVVDTTVEAEVVTGEIEALETTATLDPLSSRAAGLARLPLLARYFARPWPRAVQALLPTGQSNEGRWAPLVAWLLIDTLASNRVSAIDFFDQLQLRAALAEIFGSLGIVGEDAWRAAARVRILVAHRKGDETTGSGAMADDELFALDEFWADPDVRWLTALNEANGVTYVNQECFEEMAWWLQVPRFVEAAASGSEDKAVQQIEERLVRYEEAAREAAYDLRELKRRLKDRGQSKHIREATDSSLSRFGSSADADSSTLRADESK